VPEVAEAADTVVLPAHEDDVVFLDPRGEPMASALDYSLRLPAGPARITVLANSFPDGPAFANHLAEAISRLLPSVSLERFDKGTTDALDAAGIHEIAARADAVVALWGH
jgi:hypothetical protein